MNLVPTNKTAEELKKYIEFYNSFKPTLEKDHPDHIIADLQIFNDQASKKYTNSTWTNFFPTVIPDCDNITIILPEQIGELATYSNSAFHIDTNILLGLINNKLPEMKYEYKTYVLTEPESEDLKKEILENSQFLQKI